MKKIQIFALLVLVAFCLNCCANIIGKHEKQTTQLITMPNGQIQTVYTRETDGFSNKTESPVETANADRIHAEADYIRSIAKSFNNLSGGANQSVTVIPGNIQKIQGIKMVRVRNKSRNYIITIDSAPFKGLELGPGEESILPQPLSFGKYTLIYTEYRAGSPSSMAYSNTKTVFVNIDKDANFINVYE
jgi:hypothetical protein